MNHSLEKYVPVLDKIVISSLFAFTAFSMFSISIAQIASGLGGLAWLSRTHIMRTWHEQRWPQAIPFGLYGIACLVAVANAYDVAYSYQSLKKLLEILIFFWILNCVRDRRHRDSLTLVLISAATLAGLFGFYQAWRDGVSVMSRVEGTFSVYMTFAGLLMIVGLVAIARKMFKSQSETWLWIAIFVILNCLLFTLTRQAWLGFITGLFFLGFMWRKNLFLILSGLMVLIVFTSTVLMKDNIYDILTPKDKTFLEQMKFRFRGIVSGRDSNFEIRLALWKGGWEIFKAYPLTGCGFRCVDRVNSKFPDPSGAVKRYRGMHNNIVQLAVDTGILGLSAWLGIWFLFFQLLYKKGMVAKEDPHERDIIFGSAAAVLAFLVGGFFESNYYDSEVVMVLYFIMALPFAGSQDQSSAS
jgi:putative inorganic carbon (hco3(-)) transporter